MSSVRVRFAPSPTGPFHIGSARTAIFNWLYARHTGGTFVLRIEDTDKERNTQEALDGVLDSMTWLGLDWDEGPKVGGDYGPYFQSERSDIYARYLQKLQDAGRVYEKDGALFFKLEGERYTEYDEYHKAEIEKVRTEPVTIHDIIRGDVTRREERDFVLQRSNGDPSFHFVNVVDDIEMKITHVLRGEDHLTNTTKHIELMKALGADIPTYAHAPLILKDPSQGKGKMSKRDKGFLIDDYRKRHFLANAVRNFVTLLGWSPKNDMEVMAIEEIIERFELKDIQKSPARFDEKKLIHINFEHLKKLDLETYAESATAILKENDFDFDQTYLKQVLGICQEKINSLENLPVFACYFFSDSYPFDEKAEKKLMKKGEPIQRIEELIPALEAIADEDWKADTLESTMQSLADSNELKIFAYFPITRFATSGVSSGPDFLPMLEVIGKQRIVSRLKAFVTSHSTAGN